MNGMWKFDHYQARTANYDTLASGDSNLERLKPTIRLIMIGKNTRLANYDTFFFSDHIRGSKSHASKSEFLLIVTTPITLV